MADRRAELERKKAKLAELRQEKLRREQEKLSHDVSVAIHSMDPDSILKEIGVQDFTPIASASSTPKRQPSVASFTSVDLQRASSTCSKRSAPRLSVSKVVSQVTIAPADSVVYEKETQTSLDMVLNNRDPKTWDYYTLTYDDSGQRGEDDELTELDGAYPNVAVKRRIMEGHKSLGDIDGSQHEQGEQLEDGDQTDDAFQQLSEQECAELMMSEGFRNFVERETRIVERILCENEDGDVFIDYSRTRSGGGNDAVASSELLTSSYDFYNEALCRNRTVTSLDWSTVHTDLLLSSYANQSFGEGEVAACVVWNLRYRRCAPEYILTCPSSILSACFARNVPNLIAAGTYSGSVCVWDLRAARRSPVQRTPIGGAQGHTHPVFNVRVANAAGGSAQQLVSLSTDGRMCTWSLDMLSAPVEVLDLGWQKGARTVSSTAFTFLADGDVSSGFLVGSEDGAVYAGGGAGRQALHAAYEGHFGPVTALDCNHLFTAHTSPGTGMGSAFGGQLFVSSGFDSTVRLWSVHDAPMLPNSSNKPLATIDHAGGYITDTQWSPTHPAAFATLDSCGRVEMWNLTRDLELPLATAGGQRPAIDAHTGAGGLNLLAMSRLRWHNEGRFIAAGDACGHVTLYQVGSEIVSPKGDEYARFTRVLNNIRAECAGASAGPSSTTRIREDANVTPAT